MGRKLLNARAACSRALAAGLLVLAVAAVVATPVAARPGQAFAATESAIGSVAPPQAPSAYDLPGDAVWVSSSAQLISALQGSTARDIVLADGTYDSARPFVDSNGSHIYAQNLGGAILTAGLVLGGNFGQGGGSVQGVTFDIATPSKVLGGGIIHIWGPDGVNSGVFDCEFHGNGVIPVGVLAYNPSGLRIQRAQFFDFTDEGIRASDNTPEPYGASTPIIDTITDISVDHVSRSTPGASNGTAEAGIWIGNPVANSVARIKIRNVAWSGIETVNNSWHTTFSDLDIDMGGPYQHAGVGVYLEHFNLDNTFNRFVITGAKIGFNAEWADPSWGGVAASNGTVIENGTVDAAGSTLPGRQAGVYLDEGTMATTVANVSFMHQNWAGIGVYRAVGTAIAADDFGALAPQAQPVAYTHI